MKILNITICLCALLLCGCNNKRLLPSSVTYTESKYMSFDTIENDIGKIELGKTTNKDLLDMGIDLENMANVKRLTYLDIMSKFKLDSPSRYTLFNNIDLPEGVITSLAAREKLKAYEVNLERIVKQREGNYLLDALNFRKDTHITGWKFSCLIMIVDDVVEYVLYSGEKNIDKLEKQRNPLGPLQSFDGGDLINAASDADF
jgi:hypothetical protein